MKLSSHMLFQDQKPNSESLPSKNQLLYKLLLIVLFYDIMSNSHEQRYITLVTKPFFRHFVI